MKQRPHCGAEMKGTTIGWKCPICETYEYANGRIHLKNETHNLMHYEFPENRSRFDSVIATIAAEVADTTDRTIVQAIIKAASDMGITDLYLIDKAFIQEALSEKLAKAKNEPLTIEELRKMDGEPVYCPEERMWGIVKVQTTGPWKNKPFLIGHWGNVNCELDIGKRKLKCYRNKPAEGQP